MHLFVPYVLLLLLSLAALVSWAIIPAMVTRSPDYTLKTQTTLWKLRLHSENSDCTLKTQTTLWKLRLHSENSDYTLKTQTTLWKLRLHSENSDYTLKTQTTLWKLRLHSENSDYTLKTQTALWNLRLHSENSFDVPEVSQFKVKIPALDKPTFQTWLRNIHTVVLLGQSHVHGADILPPGPAHHNDV